MKFKRFLFIFTVSVFANTLFAENKYSRFVYNGKAGLLDSELNVVMNPDKKAIGFYYSYIMTTSYPETVRVFDENLDQLFQKSATVKYNPISDKYCFIKTMSQDIIFDIEEKQSIEVKNGVSAPDLNIKMAREKYVAGSFGYYSGTNLAEYSRNDDFMTVYPFNDKRAVIITQSFDFEIIDDNLNVVKNDVIQCAKNYSEGLLAVKTKDGKSGFINTAGEYVFNTDFYVENLDYSPKLIPELDAYFSEGVACVQTGKNKWVIYDKTGKSWNINPELKIERNTFSDGMLLVSKKDLNNKTKYGFIDKTGKEKIPCVLDSSAGFYNGIAAVVYEGKEAVLDLNGNLYFSADLMKGNKKAALKL